MFSSGTLPSVEDGTVNRPIAAAVARFQAAALRRAQADLELRLVVLGQKVLIGHHANDIVNPKLVMKRPTIPPMKPTGTKIAIKDKVVGSGTEHDERSSDAEVGRPV